MKQTIVRRTTAGVTAIVLGLTGALVATPPALADSHLVAHYPLTETPRERDATQPTSADRR
jgi:hypothetical protein